MSAMLFRCFTALLEVVRRIWSKGGIRPRKGHSAPPQGGKVRHRHRAFIELP